VSQIALVVYGVLPLYNEACKILAATMGALCFLGKRGGGGGGVVLNEAAGGKDRYTTIMN
jgi:hypothetical protein